MTDRPVVVVGRVVPLGRGSTVAPISDAIRTMATADKKLHRLLLAARAYRDGRSQVALTDLIEAAKDID
jgi:hypothetical protein